MDNEKFDEIAENEDEDIEIIDADETEENGEKSQNYEELLDRYRRTLAEFDNFRKRTIKEKSGAYDNGVHNTVEKLLPIIDNFTRALAAAAEIADETPFYQGVSLIARQLENYLAEIGVETIETIGQPFNHNLHYAVAHTEDPNFGQNEITEEMQKGYTYRTKVIRPSMVKVAN
ncbi:MAG: nucleotide exchange factor GrpE [Firmicutes bacterium]|nr:nucleotide exchange factor GrpE [Bacillota bacterium]